MALPPGPRALGDLEQMWIRTPDRHAIPFTAVAAARVGRGYASIDMPIGEALKEEGPSLVEIITDAELV